MMNTKNSIYYYLNDDEKCIYVGKITEIEVVLYLSKIILIIQLIQWVLMIFDI